MKSTRTYVNNQVKKRFYTLAMLKEKWDMDFEEIMKLLGKHKVKVYSFENDASQISPTEDRVMVPHDEVISIQRLTGMKNIKIKPKIFLFNDKGIIKQ